MTGETFTAVDLSQVPSPAVVEQLDFETILQAMLSDLISRDATFNALVESDPAYKILEVAAYREVIIRQRVNDAAHAVMLAYAIGPDLDQLGANYGVQRLLITAADPLTNTPAVYEADSDFRRRIQLSLEGYSTAGPEGAYIYHALSAAGDALDVSATSPSPGQVTVTVLSRSGNGTASSDLITAVQNAVNADDVRPLTDQVTVQGATIVDYAVTATIYTYAGPDPDVIIANAQTSMQAYADAMHMLGLDVTLAGVYAALHVEGVQDVVLANPTANIVTDRTQASYCTGITLTNGGIGE
jgi:phage-related baseplate assembly protein